ncbi:hypothetical protein D3C76_1062380 [compost metagenome]
MSRGAAWVWDRPSPNMIAAAEILSASLVLDNAPGLNLPVSSFIANTSDGFPGAAWQYVGNEPLLLARLAKCQMSRRDENDANLSPKVTG